VVVPCYGCESCLRALHERLVKVLTPLVERFEIILVDDRSKQGDWAVIQDLAATDSRVRGVRLCRNFGQHFAIAAGLRYAEGDHVVVMDCDLQDPPEEIARMYEHSKAGSHAVFARRLGRKDARRRLVLGALFGKVNGLLSGQRIDTTIGNFSIISRQIVLQLNQFRERTRSYSKEVWWLGYETALVDIQHQERHSGVSSHSLTSQLRHALDTILSQSTRPLYASVGVGLFSAVSAAVAGLFLVARKLITGQVAAGWTSVMVALFFVGGLLATNMGVLGLYIGNIFLELKGRPTFIVERTTFGETHIDAMVSARTTSRVS